ncbi:MAG: efflux RND transporter periplasmic adaptor subunit [Burkholderiales bacterium]|nr:efflux RND transporter periplasmic adaptor subunit [Burkholderiales bacterium]
MINKYIIKSTVIIAIILIISGCSGKKKEVLTAIPVMTVTVTKPQVKYLPVWIHANGRIQAWQETIIGAEISGLDISDVYVNVGDEVHKGQLLAKLNVAQVNTDLLQQIANVAEATANLEQAQTEANQATILQNAGAISSQELLQYKTKAKTNQAKLDAANAALKLQQLKIDYTLIKAPDNGVISSRTATVGSVVQNGSELFRLVRGDRLEWQAEVSLLEMTKIKTGQPVEIINDLGKLVVGKVRQVSPTLNQNTRNGIAYVDLPLGTNLKLGTYMGGNIEYGKNWFIEVPNIAVVNRDGYDYVMVLNAAHKVKQTKVQLYTYRNNFALIESGITVNDTIIVDGVGFLHDGDLVSVAESSSLQIGESV